MNNNMETVVFDTWDTRHDVYRMNSSSFVEALKSLIQMEVPSVVYTEGHHRVVADLKTQLKRNQSGFYYDFEFHTLADVASNFEARGGDRMMLVGDDTEYPLSNNISILFVAAPCTVWKVRFYFASPLKPEHEFEISYDARLYSGTLRYQLASASRVVTSSHVYENGRIQRELKPV